ncbi:MAG: SDR family oxidoreductase [Erythrobacter sp.]|jgi:NAD(P)-dependent dehydrogenase (short-subunit alcohol dehydrogenase family)|nr:SDR family oxidoreductase [Erythrobacter sp.]
MSAENKRAIFISGGASGIGRAIACHFAERGWFVGIGDVNHEGMEDTLGLMPVGFTYMQRLDVRDRADWNAALAGFALAAGSRIDVVVNNAGIGTGGLLAELEPDEIERCLDINLKGVLFGAQAAYPHLQKTAPGSALINIASAAGLAGSPGASVYCATKFGVRGVSESLDAEWAGDGIKVASICPGFIETPLLEGTGSRRSNETIRSRVAAAGLEITPVSEVAEAVWQAVHDEKLDYLVGATARRLAFGKRWMPGRLRKQLRGGTGVLGR